MLDWLKILFTELMGLRRHTQKPSGEQKPQSQKQPQAQRKKAQSFPFRGTAPLGKTQTKHTPPSKFQVSPSDQSQAIWVPPGKSIQVAEYLIPGGMIYVGTQLKDDNPNSRNDPCLINPNLQIETKNPNYAGADMGYWPAYNQISASNRAAYLEWLANDRSDPNAAIGYVFLFFYGLERRVLRDFQYLNTDISEELAQITSELTRLLSIYGHSKSFQGYASGLLDVCRLLQKPKNISEMQQPPLERIDDEMPLSLKIGLGQLVASSQPIPADWLFSWYLHSEKARLRTPATRCSQEFQKLLKIKYQQQYGQGMILKASKQKLQARYRPASFGFVRSSITLQINNLPDITAKKTPLDQLQVLIDECTDALDPYSRWLGRNDGNPDSRVALALLPPELIADLKDSEIHRFGQWLSETLGKNKQVQISTDELLCQWSSPAVDKLTKAESTTLAQGLEKLRCGLEPDVRFGGKPLKKGGRVVLFKPGSEDISALSQDYTAAMSLMHLAATVAKVGNTADILKQQYLEEYLETSLHLSEAERIRLKAHLTWLLQEKLSLRGLKNNLDKMSSNEKSEVANFLISVAGANGQISPSEISTLSKIYPLLGFEPDDVYSHIHNFSTDRQVTSTDPVTVKPATVTSSGYAIPIPLDEETKNARIKSKKETSEFTLNLETIRQKQRESARVASLLGDIFAEEEAQSLSLELETDFESIAGLDTLHSQLLQVMAQQESWSRDHLEIQASNLELMLDGALEVINDVAFEICDESLTDGEDLIKINAEVLEQLLSS
ncbi:hypothetical protein GS597_06710 [Synechococcales cyanobacterium C]|uniref:Tellurite resistance protein TerB n=1 Tax=Petrachloros mirabilis ULC683 TaxID=2781853 RepID=A0A8K1ZWK6_9CYAN|nr:TerB N-terminal domain-containing protein [Petrachloros mirabilis]NCJ06213.1 hypothetical protein [Petrachloros mirabilis ULC683]